MALKLRGAFEENHTLATAAKKLRFHINRDLESELGVAVSFNYLLVWPVWQTDVFLSVPGVPDQVYLSTPLTYKEGQETFTLMFLFYMFIHLFVCQTSGDTSAFAAPMETSINLQPLPAKHAGKVSLVIDQVS